MFKWTEDTVRFREDAALYNGMEKKLADELSRRIPKDASVCDLGCGLGFLGLELADLGYSVTAVDIDDLALEVLEKNKRLRGLKDEQLQIVKADAFDISESTKWDVITMCFFGNTEESLRLLKKHCTGKGIIIKGYWEKRRFAGGDQRRNKVCTMDAAEELSVAGIPFRVEKVSAETGQPFRSQKDADLFFEIYGGGRGEREFQPTGSADFPLFYSCPRDLGLLMIDAGNIPDSYI